MPESTKTEKSDAAASSADRSCRQGPGLAAQVHGPDRRLRRDGRLPCRLRQRQRHDHQHDATTTKSGSSETEQFGKGDIGILNYALTLEYLETAFYADVVKSGLFKGAELAAIKKFGAEEAEHVTALTAAVKSLGGKPAPEPKAEFPLESAKSVLELAGTVENLGAAAYLGQAGNIESPEVLASALAIHSVEGRHAAALNTLLGTSITPDGAFAKPADAKTVLKSVEPFIVS